jgi:hypothetical protein
VTVSFGTAERSQACHELVTRTREGSVHPLGEVAAVSEADEATSRRASAFTLREHEVIAGWVSATSQHCWRAGIRLDRVFLDEALRVTLDPADEILWLVQWTGEDTVAVRAWPGVAELVPTIEAALVMIERAMCPHRRAANA